DFGFPKGGFGRRALGVSVAWPTSRFFEVNERITQRDGLIAELLVLVNRVLVVEPVSYLKEIHGQEMEKHERFRTMLVKSYDRLRWNRWSISMSMEAEEVSSVDGIFEGSFGALGLEMEALVDAMKVYSG
ncbi:hypothetical protein Tco_1455664, partial [Tanacetum coccineum]